MLSSYGWYARTEYRTRRDAKRVFYVVQSCLLNPIVLRLFLQPTNYTQNRRGTVQQHRWSEHRWWKGKNNKKKINKLKEIKMWHKQPQSCRYLFCVFFLTKTIMGEDRAPRWGLQTVHNPMLEKDQHWHPLTLVASPWSMSNVVNRQDQHKCARSTTWCEPHIPWPPGNMGDTVCGGEEFPEGVPSPKRTQKWWLIFEPQRASRWDGQIGCT